MAVPHKIENRIWKHRIAKGLKQSQLALLIGQKNSSQISRYERGLAIPHLEQLVKLCYGLEVGIGSLYPQLISKWQGEVDNGKDRLRDS